MQLGSWLWEEARGNWICQFDCGLRLYKFHNWEESDPDCCYCGNGDGNHQRVSTHARAAYFIGVHVLAPQDGLILCRDWRQSLTWDTTSSIVYLALLLAFFLTFLRIWFHICFKRGKMRVFQLMGKIHSGSGREGGLHLCQNEGLLS